MPTELEQRARELLAAEYERQGSRGFAEALRFGGDAGTDVFYLRAIVAALQAQQPGAQAVAIVGDDLYPGWVDDAPDLPPGTKLYTQPPSIPEPSQDDAKAALAAFNLLPVPGSTKLARMLASIAADRARLRERIGGGS